MKRIGCIPSIAAVLVLVLASATWADFQWEQVASEGFGVPGNWSMYGEEVLQVGETPYLYMGTANTTGGEVWRSPDGKYWENVFKGDAHQTYMKYAGVFRGRLYMGTSTESAGFGAEIWRTDGSAWDQVTDNGYGDENNKEMLSSAVFGRYFYFGTGNDSTGAEIWRTRDGRKWKPVMEDGFGDANTIEISYLIEFRGVLYAGTENKITGAEVWRTRNGVKWRPVKGTMGGFGNRRNTEIHAMAVHNGYLYAVTENGEGGEVWRSPNGERWRCVVSGGFGGARVDFKEAVSFARYLWVGTAAPSGGCAQIYRSASGSRGTWENALENVPMEVGCITAFKAFKNALYVGTQGPAEIWRVRSQDPLRPPRRHLRRPARALPRCWPNPFNAEATVSYEVAETSVVHLAIYALNGQCVRTLINETHPAGNYSVTWNGRDGAGRDVASGVYLCRMVAGSYSAVGKLVLMK